MNGTSTLHHAPRRKAHWTIPWIALALCFCLTVGVFSADLFSIVYPQAPGTDVLSSGKVRVDISNSSQGYIMVKHDGSSKRLKTLITYDGNIMKYDQNQYGEYVTFPLQYGSGKYTVEVFEQSKGDQYAKVFSKSLTATLINENAAFLCPSQYVWYTPTTTAVVKSFELCEGLETDMEKAKALYNYVGSTVMYDYMKALSVQSNKQYLPDVDETLSTKMGICFDYSALLACMMRVQGIPTKLVIGNLVSQNQYHAWNEAYIDGKWRLMDATFMNNSYPVTDYVMERFY